MAIRPAAMRVIAAATATASLFLGSSLIASAGAPAVAVKLEPRSQARPLVLIYRGPLSCDGCSEAAAGLIRAYSPRFRVRYVGPGESLPVAPRAFRHAALYVQPGGDVPVGRAPHVLGRIGARAIRQYVARGGRYLGICQGAYLAGRPGLGLLGQGDTGQYIVSRGAVTRSAGDLVLPVHWAGERRMVFFQDGPYMHQPAKSGQRILARYTNGLIAAMSTPFGRGRIGLVGPHPEAPRSWFTPAMRRADIDGSDRDLGIRLIRQTLH